MIFREIEFINGIKGVYAVISLSKLAKVFVKEDNTFFIGSKKLIKSEKFYKKTPTYFNIPEEILEVKDLITNLIELEAI